MEKGATKFTPEELERAKAYTEHVVHEVETALIAEIEKMEGRVPANWEINKYGRQVLNKDMSMDYYWRGVLLVSVKPHQVNEEGQRGTNLIIHKQPERLPEITD